MNESEKSDSKAESNSPFRMEPVIPGDPDINTSLQAALLESEERFKHTFDNAAIGRAMATPQGKFLKANPAFCNLLGYSEKELLPLNWRQITHPEDLEKVSSYTVGMMEGRTSYFHHIHRLIRKDEQPIWVDLNVGLVRDATGAPRYVIGDIVDLTDLKLAQISLLESKEHFEKIISQIPVAIVITDLKGDIEYFNDQFITEFGYTLEDVRTAEQWWQAAYPNEEYRKIVQQSWADAMDEASKANSRIGTQTWDLTCKDGSVRTVEFDMMPLGEISVIAMMDITGHRKTEEALYRHSMQMEALQDAALELTSHLVIKDVLETILVQLEKVLPFDAGTFHILEGEATRIVGLHNAPASMMGNHHPLVEFTFNRELVESDAPIIIQDIQVDSRGFRLAGEVKDMRCILGVPLRAGRRNMGILILKHLQPNAFSQADAKIAQTFAQQAAVAIENADLYEQAQHEIVERRRAEDAARRHSEEVSLLNQIALAITSGVDSAEALQQVCTRMAEFVDVPQTGFAMLNAQRDAAIVIAEHSPAEIPSSIGVEIPVSGNPSMKYVLENKKPLQIMNAQTDSLMEPVWELMRQRNVLSLLISPVIVDGEVMGTLGFDSFKQKEYRQSQIDIIQQVANQAGQMWVRKRAQEELAESEQRHRRLFETMNQGVVYLSAEGHVINANPAAQEILGQSLDQLQGRTPRDPHWHTIREDNTEIPIEDHPAQVALRTGMEVRNFVMGVCHAQGKSPRWIQINAAPLFRQGEHHPFQVYATFEDITSSRKAQEELETRFRQQTALTLLSQQALVGSDLTPLFEKVVTIVAETIGVEYCKVLELQPGGDMMLLRSGVGWKEGLVGHALVETGIDSQAGYTLDSNTPVVVSDLRTEKRFSGPHLLIGHDVISGISVIIGQQSKPFGVLGVHSTRKIEFAQNDINFLQSIANVLAEAIQRKRIENALRESEERFALATSAAQVGVWELDILTGKLYYDARLKAMLGYQAHEISFDSEEWWQHVHPEDVLDIRTRFNEMSLGHLSQLEYEYRMKHRDGSIVWFRTNAMAIRNENELLSSLVGLDANITERKQMEEALQVSQKMADIGIVAAGIAHEINTPLQVITGLSGRILSQLGDDKLETERLPVDMKTLDRNAWRVARIVRSLLTYARTSLDEVEPHNLSEIVSDTLVLIEHQLKTWSNIDIVQHLDEDLPLLNCDRSGVSQVLINLLTNARDAMPSGGEIRIRTGYDTAKACFGLQVTDTGSGIPDEQHKKIFDPFFTTKDIGEGTGMGLPIVLSIVQAHGGEIQVESEPGKGTTMSICLPETPPLNLPEEDMETKNGRYLP
jgi:PAS domain S-box-containing protein